MRLVIDIPDDQVAEFARLVAAHLATLGQVPPRGPDRPPARVAESGHPPDDRRPTTAADRPLDGRSLLGWASKRGQKDQLLALGKARKFPGKVIDWSDGQVKEAWSELSLKPPKGSQHWGAAGSGHPAPK